MKSLYMATAVVAGGLLLSACSKNESETAPAAASKPVAAQSHADAKKAAIKALAQTYPRVDIDTDAGLFWFEPRSCDIGRDAGSGLMHYRIEGAGKSPDGLPVFVTVSDESTDPTVGPDMRINVGTDKPNKTTEVSWISNRGMAHSMTVPRTKATIDNKRLTLQGVVFSRNGSDRLTVKAPFVVDCTQPK